MPYCTSTKKHRSSLSVALLFWSFDLLLKLPTHAPSYNSEFDVSSYPVGTQPILLVQGHQGLP